MELLRLMLLALLWTHTAGQEDPLPVTQVSCVFMETCLLPCSFESSGGLLLIQWGKVKEKLLVYAYKPGVDLTDKQDAPFKGRSSMFPEQISQGNASLQLSAVTVNDQGVYHCVVTTDSDAEEWIHLSVRSGFSAPSVEQKGDVLVCSSEGIYPQPNVSWAPHSGHKTQLEQRDSQLYSVTSSINLDPQPQQYTCNISTDSSWKSATYSLQPPMEMSTNVTIPCVDTVVPEKSLKWTFNHIHTIVSRSGAVITHTAPWRLHVESLSESGSLSLKELSQEQQGVYICELHTDDITYISRTVLGVTSLISPDDHWAVVVGVTVLLVLVLVLIIVVLLLRRKHQPKRPQTVLTENQPNNTVSDASDCCMQKKEEEELLIQGETNILRRMLQDTFKNLSEKEFLQFKNLLTNHKVMEGFSLIPRNKLEVKDDISESMIKAYGVRSINVTKRLLKKLRRNDLLEKLSEWNYDPGELVETSKNNMKCRLRERFRSVPEGLSGSSGKMEFNEGYTELFISEGGSGQINLEHEVRLMETHSRKSAQERTVLCQDIFNTEDTKTPIRVVLTKGVAGVGKTVLTQKFSLDWAEGKANQDIELLFHFTFRELNVLRRTRFSLVGLLHHCFRETEALCSFEGLQLLFIFDGLDECSLPLDFRETQILTDPNESASVEKLLVNLIKGNLLPSARIWITTRPAAANQIPPGCVSMVTEVRGFTDEQKDEYFMKRIRDEQQATAVISHIKKSRSLYIMCHIAVFCWILLTVLLHVMETGETGQLPSTLTQMYIHFLVVQAKVKNIKYHEGTGADLHWTPEARKMVRSLGKLAFEQLQKGNLIFYESDFRDCELDAAEVAQSGVFTEVFKEEPGLYQTKVYCFIHLSVQEFLAALHVHHTFYSFGVNLLSTLTPDPKENLLSPPLTSDPKENLLSPLTTDPKENLLSPPHSSESPDPGPTPEEVFYRSAVDQALLSPNGHLDLFLRFLLGLSLPTNQRLLEGLLTETGSDQTNQETVKYIKEKLNEEGVSAEGSLNLLHCLNELNDHDLLEEIQWVMRRGGLSYRDMSPVQWSAMSFLLLSSDSNLEEFDLRKYCPTEDGLLKLLPVVKASTKVTLSCCGLTSLSCAPGSSLASVLSSSSSLTQLDLSNNDLQDSGVELLCEGLKSALCRLHTLRLSGCMISEKGGAFLATTLNSALSHVTELDLSYNHPGSSTELLTALQAPQGPLQTLRLDPSGERFMVPGLRKYACEFSLDPNTVHRRLLLSEDHRSVTCIKADHLGLDHEDRLTVYSQVLSSTGLRGRCYWEVDWKVEGRGRGIVIAVSYRGIRRKRRGESEFGANDQSWSLKINGGGERIVRHNNHKTRLTDRGVFLGKVRLFSHSAHRPRAVSLGRVGVSTGRVGVFLDWEGGALSFYDVVSDEGQSHLYTFTNRFTEELFPGFGLGYDSSVSMVNLNQD